jgi:uncharacterized peroxidase-related enzyme
MAPRIAPVTAADAPEATRPILESLKKALGMVPNLYATIGHSPAALQGVLALGDALGKGTLSRREVELLNLHVSELNGCAYCVSAHTMLAGKAAVSAAEAAAARAGHSSNVRENALLALARRVVRTGGGGAGAEVAAAREAGLSDGGIVEVLAHVANRALANSIAILARVEIDFPKAPRLPEG